MIGSTIDGPGAHDDEGSVAATDVGDSYSQSGAPEADARVADPRAAGSDGPGNGSVGKGGELRAEDLSTENLGGTGVSTGASAREGAVSPEHRVRVEHDSFSLSRKEVLGSGTAPVDWSRRSRIASLSRHANEDSRRRQASSGGGRLPAGGGNSDSESFMNAPIVSPSAGRPPRGASGSVDASGSALAALASALAEG